MHELPARAAQRLNQCIDACAIGFVSWLWFSLTLALLGIFYTPLLIAGTLGMGVFGIYMYSSIVRNSKHSDLRSIKFPPFSTLFIITGVIVYVAFPILRATPTLFSGRDQGSYSSAAYHLAQEHSLVFSTTASDAFFKIYGPGKALNFPGYDYTESGKLVTQFPLGYIVWLGSMISLFSITGIAIAQILTALLFLGTFYALLRNFIPRSYALGGVITILTSLSMVWFSKITLSENLAATLFILLVYSLVMAAQQSSSKHALLAVSLAGFFAFTRIEGFVFLCITLAIIYFARNSESRKAKTEETHPLRHTLFLPKTLFFGSITFALFIYSLFVNTGFYKVLAKAGLRLWSDVTIFCVSNCVSTSTTTSLWSIFWSYGMLPTLIIGCISIFILFKKRNLYMLIPIILTLPAFFYLIQPSISGDQPWMLRRYIFSLYPGLVFTALLGIYTIQKHLSVQYKHVRFFQKHWYAGMLISIMILAQLPFAVYVFAYSDNAGLLEQTNQFSQKFSPTDLVLVDRMTTGNAWTMIPEPLSLLHDIPSAYFFNMQDLEHLDTSRFTHVYLVIPATDTEATQALITEHTGKQSSPIDTFTFSTTILGAVSASHFPSKQIVQQQVTLLELE